MFGHQTMFDGIWLKTFPIWTGLKRSDIYLNYDYIIISLSLTLSVSISVFVFLLSQNGKLERVLHVVLLNYGILFQIQ